MRITVCVMTHNVYSTMRADLLNRCWESIALAFPSADRYLFDNCSDDGSVELAFDLCSSVLSEDGSLGQAFSIDAGNGLPGSGRNFIYEELKSLPEPNIVVFSDDDMLWREGAESKLVELWSNAPEDLAIACGLLEPVWDWNTPRETIMCGNVPVLIRDSAPGAAWSMRYDMLRGRDEPFCPDFGYDYRFCCHLREEEGLRIGQLDLAEHVGWGRSTHGNDAMGHVEMRPLDRKKWMV